MADHIIHSEDGQTYDLTQNRIAFGLLPDDVQEAMKAWPHGWELFYGCGKWKPWEPKWSAVGTYRAKPVPKAVEHVLFWKAGVDATMSERNYDTHRIIIRDDGTGNMTATVDAL